MLFHINQFLNGRLELANIAFDTFGFNFFGQSIHWIGSGANFTDSVLLSEYNFVDCSYMKNIFDFGLIYTLIILLAYIVLLKSFYENHDMHGILIIFTIMIICIFEPRLIQLEFNAFIILLSPILMGNNNELKKFIL